MIILHAAFCGASLFLWGESSDEAKVVSKSAEAPAPAAHFDLGAAGLQNLALELGVGPIAKSKAKSKSKALPAREVFAWLTTADGQPISSLSPAAVGAK